MAKKNEGRARDDRSWREAREALASGEFFRRGKLEADLALGDFAQGGVFGGEFFQRFDERAVTAAELFHASRDDVHEDRGVANNFQCALEVIVSHDGMGSRRVLGDGRTVSAQTGEHEVFLLLRR